VKNFWRIACALGTITIAGNSCFCENATQQPLVQQAPESQQIFDLSFLDNPDNLLVDGQDMKAALEQMDQIDQEKLDNMTWGERLSLLSDYVDIKIDEAQGNIEHTIEISKVYLEAINQHLKENKTTYTIAATGLGLTVLIVYLLTHQKS